MGWIATDVCVWDIAAWLLLLAVVIAGTVRLILLHRKEKALEHALAERLAVQALKEYD
ncbi:hypothetical protein [Lachnoclostridium sp. An131]|uniref:hypothetical protein n=1 Tax=Lachnoclostridium sp. An131 TaxID=1965555 RepID=UPI0013A65D67|nr:hypothetical protein [Lachnoclostridium sp. An131]